MRSLTAFWLKRYLKQGRLMVLYALAMLLFLMNAFIYSGRWGEDLENQNQAVRNLQDAYDSVSSPNELAGSGFNLVMPATPLRFLADNNLEEVPTRRRVSTRNSSLPASAESQRRQITGLWDIDLSFIVSVVFTFLAVVLAFDSVSGEREQGTLKMLLTTRASRYQIILSKFLAAIIALLLPVIVGLAADFLLLNVFGVASFDMRQTAILGLFFIYTVLLLAFFTALSMLISSLTRSSITSLIVLLLAWVLLVIVVPGAGKPIAKEAVKAMTPEEYSKSMDRLSEDFFEEFKRRGALDRPAAMARSDNFKYERVWDGVMEDFQRRLQSAVEAQLSALYRQAETAELVARFSPNTVFKQAVSGIVGSDLEAVREFHRQAARYKEALFTFLGEQDRPYLSRDGVFDQQHDSPGLLHSDGRGYLSFNPLTADIPRFEFRPRGLTERLAGALPDTVILVVLAALALAAAVFAFNRYDVR
jgi:ABC-type transport system involved in multi-copper enzyme maturation permease subunit